MPSRASLAREPLFAAMAVFAAAAASPGADFAAESRMGPGARMRVEAAQATRTGEPAC